MSPSTLYLGAARPLQGGRAAEVFHLPAHHLPARAFGVGVVVATQSPMDLDYRPPSNAGLWFLGRL